MGRADARAAMVLLPGQGAMGLAKGTQGDGQAEPSDLEKQRAPGRVVMPGTGKTRGGTNCHAGKSRAAEPGGTDAAGWLMALPSGLSAWAGRAMLPPAGRRTGANGGERGNETGERRAARFGISLPR